MIVVSDTTAISSLHRIKQVHLLEDIFGEVIIPKQVFDELAYFEKVQSSFNLLQTYPWIKVQEAHDTALINSLEQVLDVGESSAIALSIEIKADLLLIDEKLGRKVAIEKGLAIVGLVGVLEIAKKRRLVPLIKPLLDDLIQKANFRIGRDLYERILLAANEK